MLIDRLSSPSTGAATMVRPIAVPSLPLAVRTVPVRTAASATGLTVRAEEAPAGVQADPPHLVPPPFRKTEFSAEVICRPARSAVVCFFFNDTATTEIYTLSLHDALPILLIDRLSSPSTGAATMVRPIAVPSLPLAVRTVPVRTAASATGLTV